MNTFCVGANGVTAGRRRGGEHCCIRVSGWLCFLFDVMGCSVYLRGKKEKDNQKDNRGRHGDIYMCIYIYIYGHTLLYT